MIRRRPVWRGHATDAFALWLAGGTVPGTIQVPTSPEGAVTAPAVSEASTEGAVMPDIPCGTDLQDAQDLVQETGVFLARARTPPGRTECRSSTATGPSSVSVRNPARRFRRATRCSWWSRTRSSRAADVQSMSRRTHYSQATPSLSPSRSGFRPGSPGRGAVGASGVGSVTVRERGDGLARRRLLCHRCGIPDVQHLRRLGSRRSLPAEPPGRREATGVMRTGPVALPHLGVRRGRVAGDRGRRRHAPAP